MKSKILDEVKLLRSVVDAARIFVKDIDRVIQTTRSERRLANMIDRLDATFPYVVITHPEPTDSRGRPLFGPRVSIKK